MLIDKLKQRFGAELLAAESSHGEEVITVGRDAAPAVLRALRDEPDFDFKFLIDLTAVDWMGREPRFEVVYQLKSLSRNHRLRVKVPLPGDDAWVKSAVELWKSADWVERECFDMFGIDFKEPSRPAPYPDVRLFRRASAAQGLSGGPPPADRRGSRPGQRSAAAVALSDTPIRRLQGVRLGYVVAGTMDE